MQEHTNTYRQQKKARRLGYLKLLDWFGQAVLYRLSQEGYPTACRVLVSTYHDSTEHTMVC